MSQIDIQSESPVMLSEIRKSIPNEPSYHTMWRWTEYGVVNRQGVRVYLDYVLLTQGRATTMRAYRRFITELQY